MKWSFVADTVLLTLLNGVVLQHRWRDERHPEEAHRIVGENVKKREKDPHTKIQGTLNTG